MNNNKYNKQDYITSFYFIILIIVWYLVFLG